MSRPGPAERASIVTLAIDAGGSFLKGGILVDGRLLTGPRLHRPSHSGGDAGEIIGHLADAAQELAAAYMGIPGADPTPDMDLQKAVSFRLGFAFPGPFDYEAGISLIRGLNKYDRLYGCNLKELLQKELKVRAAFADAPSWMAGLAAADIRFGNDAALFALGVSRLFPQDRLLCLTLGTGLGSAFIERRVIVSGRDGVPASGMLYAERFEEALVDDLFGSRGILALGDSLHARRNREDVYALAVSARAGAPAAVQVWETYGRRLGEMLRPYVAAFRPDRIVLGGQIARSLDLFAGTLMAALIPEATELHAMEDMPEHVFYGVHELLNSSSAGG